MLQRESINTSIAKNIPFEPTRPRVFFRGITNEIAAVGQRCFRGGALCSENATVLLFVSGVQWVEASEAAFWSEVDGDVGAVGSTWIFVVFLGVVLLSALK